MVHEANFSLRSVAYASLAYLDKHPTLDLVMVCVHYYAINGISFVAERKLVFIDL